MKPEKCIVRIYENDPIIFFPERDANLGMINSWMKIGQHGEASIKLLTQPFTRKATKQETDEIVLQYENYYKCQLHPVSHVKYKEIIKNWPNMA